MAKWWMIRKRRKRGRVARDKKGSGRLTDWLADRGKRNDEKTIEWVLSI